MTGIKTLWRAIQKVLTSDRFIRLQEVYELIGPIVQLDREDFESDAPGSVGLRWHRNVRNVLQTRKQTGDVQWDPSTASYRLVRGSVASQADQPQGLPSPVQSIAIVEGGTAKGDQPDSVAAYIQMPEQAQDLQPAQRVVSVVRRIV